MMKQPSTADALLRIAGVAILIIAAFALTCALGQKSAGHGWFACECGEAVWKELRQWQTGLGAMIGLFGVAYASYRNAALARERDDREQEKATRRLLAALIAEAEAISGDLSGLSTNIMLRQNEDTFVPTTYVRRAKLPAPKIFEASYSKLDSLPATAVRKLVRTWHLYNNTIERLRLAGEESEDILSDDTVSLLVQDLTRRADRLDKLAIRLKTHLAQH